MNSTLKLGGGLVAACAACCAVSFAPALLAGTSLIAVSGAAWAWEIGLIVLAIPVAAAVYYFARRKEASTDRSTRPTFQKLLAASPEEGCGCGASCNASAKDEAPIACTLDAGDFKERTAGIRDLARRSLHPASRTPLTLTLTYGPEALEEVRALVAKEQSCCAFLVFDLKSNVNSVLLTITAPKAAADAADALFDHFAPDLAASNTKELA